MSPEGGRAATARLFVALELPTDAVTVLVAWMTRALDAGASVPTGPPLRPVAREALHVTLCFLGARPLGDVCAITAACHELAGAGAVRLGLGEPVWLPRRRPRVLAVGLEDEGARLAAVQARLARALATAGLYTPEARPFLPHVTVARFGRGGGEGSSGSGGSGRGVGGGRGGTAVVLVPARPAPLSFTAVSVALLRSHPRPGGSHYERLAAVTLG